MAGACPSATAHPGTCLGIVINIVNINIINAIDVIVVSCNSEIVNKNGEVLRFN